MRAVFNTFYFERKTMSEMNELLKNFDKAYIGDENGKTISFESRGLKLESEEDAREVAAEIDRADAVHGIIFKGNTIGVGAAKKIGQSLAKRAEFQRALWSDMFTGRLKAEIPSALIALCHGIQTAGAHLVELDLSDNAFGPNGARGIEGFLRSPSAYSLQILKLNNNGLGITGGKMIANALHDCYESSVAAGTPLKLRVFVGGRNRLENDGAVALADCFRRIGTLEEVTMPQNGIYFVGITALAAAFSQNPNMRVINLSDNTFTEKGALAIADVMHTMKNLKVINFDDCLLKPDGGSILARGLTKSCPLLEELHLNGNEFDTVAGLAILRALHGKQALKLIDINANGFGGEGIGEIIRLADELNLSSLLGSFDDDDGDGYADDDEDENGEEAENEKENEGHHEIDVENGNYPKEFGQKQVSTPAMMGNGTPARGIFGLPPRTPTAPGIEDSFNNSVVERLYLQPDVANLIALEERLPQEMGPLLREHLRNPNNIIGFVFGVASLDSNTSDVRQKIQQCCEGLLKQAFETKHSGQMTNEILEHLGVIKSENEIRKPANIGRVLSMLSSAVKRDWFPADSRSTLAFLIEKRKNKVGADEAALSELMTGLSLNISL